MTLTITPADQLRALREYRYARLAGLAPRAAAWRAMDVFARSCAAALVDDVPYTAQACARSFAAARRYVVDIDLRMDDLPFWQTGKITVLPAPMRCTCQSVFQHNMDGARRRCPAVIVAVATV